MFVSLIPVRIKGCALRTVFPTITASARQIFYHLTVQTVSKQFLASFLLMDHTKSCIRIFPIKLMFFCFQTYITQKLFQTIMITNLMTFRKIYWGKCFDRLPFFFSVVVVFFLIISGSVFGFDEIISVSHSFIILILFWISISFNSGDFLKWSNNLEIKRGGLWIYNVIYARKLIYTKLPY